MGYSYYSDKKFDRDKFQASIEGCLEMGRFRLNPSLGDVDSLIFLHRRPIIAQWLAELPKDLLLLDIGGRIQPYRPLIENQVRRYIGLDLQREGLVNVICTAEHLPFEDGCCDVVLSTDTLQLVIPRSLLRGQSFLVPSGGWRTRGTRQLERERTVRGKSTTTLSFP
jgi:hypothetical protein